MRLVAIILTLVILGWCRPVDAHAVLTGSDPPEGAILTKPVAQFTLRFMGPVSVLRLRLASAGNVVTDLSGATLKGNELVIPAPRDLGRGTHLLLWRVVGQDIHTSAGILTFSIGEAGQTPTVPLNLAGGLDGGIWFAEMLLNMCLFIGVGGGLFRLWQTGGQELPRLASRIVSGALVVAMATAVIAAGMQGLEALDASWAALLSRDAWQASIATNYIYTLVLVCLASFGMLAAMRSSNRALARGLSVLALLLAAGAITTSGHAAANYPLWAGRLGLFVHAVCLTVWIGALVPLAALSLLTRADLWAVLRRFSATIPLVIAALLVSGIVLASLQLRSPYDLLATPFGQVLSAKVGLVVLLLGLAAYNRFALTPRCHADAPGAQRSLALSVGVELGLVLAVVGTAGLWRFAPPPVPRTQMVSPIFVNIKGGEASAWLSLSAGFKQYRSMTISLSGKDASPLVAKEVELIARHTSGIAAPLRLAARNDGDGKWRIDNLYLSYPGIWMFRLDIKIDRTKSVQLEDQFVVNR